MNAHSLYREGNMNIDEAKKKVVEAGIKLVKRGLTARTWGNISCRVDNEYFVITPSGRDYISLTPNDIVLVAIKDGSYNGDIKPSSEKGIHAGVYRQKKDVNFIIHTHQDGASVISALGMEYINVPSKYKLLGGKVVCAAYGLPGTAKLRKGVLNALSISSGSSIIMKKHGALCYAENDDQAFKAAEELELASNEYVIEKYLKEAAASEFSPHGLRKYYLKNSIQGIPENIETSNIYKVGERSGTGFTIYDGDNKELYVDMKGSDEKLKNDIRIFRKIYKEHNDINYIIHVKSPNIVTISLAGKKVLPYLDDFAQIVGTSLNIADNEPERVDSAIGKASAVLIKGNGALCFGSTKEDAEAVGIIMEKNCRVLVEGSLFGKLKPINKLECMLMRFVYLKKYSKQINKR